MKSSHIATGHMATIERKSSHISTDRYGNKATGREKIVSHRTVMRDILFLLNTMSVFNPVAGISVGLFDESLLSGFKPGSAGTVFIRQNQTSVDVRF